VKGEKGEKEKASPLNIAREGGEGKGARSGHVFFLPHRTLQKKEKGSRRSIFRRFIKRKKEEKGEVRVLSFPVIITLHRS